MSIDKDVSVIRDYVENSYGDEDGRGKALEAIERLAEGIKEAVLNEREACAQKSESQADESGEGRA